MKIRTRLALQFTFIVGSFVLLILVITYLLFANFKEETFLNILSAEANITAKRLLTDNGIDMIYTNTRQSTIPNVCEKVYTLNDSLIFNTDDNDILKIDELLLKKIREEKYLQFKIDNYYAIGSVYSENNMQLISIIAAIDKNGIKEINYLFKLQLLGLLFSLVLVFIGGWVLAGEVLDPLKKVIQKVKGISAGQLNIRIDESKNNDEISELIKTFNRLLDRIEKTVEIQKGFISNASHELRNPLTAITGQLEVSLMKEREAQAYRTTISSALEDIKSINDISDNLLMLAKTSIFEKNNGFVAVRIDEILWEAREELLKLHPDFIVEINISEKFEEEYQLMVSGNKNLLKIAIMNLTENACKYSVDHKAQVELLTDSANILILHIENTGDGISVADIKNIFNPFFRGENAIGIKGHGIGLSLVQNIIRLHNGVITVQSEPNFKTLFTVKFIPHIKVNRILMPI